MERILVTGATGNIGRQVVVQLRAEGRRVRALSRRPQAAGLPPDVEVIGGDLSAPETLDAALDGVDAVFLVWALPVTAAARAVERIAARAGRIVLISSPHRTPHPFFQQPNALRAVHARLEELVEACGARWTVLRPGPFALNCLHWWAPQIASGDVVRWFHAEAATAAVHERDVAAVAVRALCDEGHHGRDCVLTGPESLTQREQLAIVASAIGRALRFDEVSPAAARRELLGSWPPSIADMLLDAYAAAVGRPALVTSGVADVTGAPARTFRSWALDHAADFPRRI